MNKLPDCPMCEEDELFITNVWVLHVACYLCGWSSDDIEVQDSETVDEAIVRVVEAAKEPSGD